MYVWRKPANYLAPTQTLLMGLGVVPDLLVSVDKLDLGWIRRWLSDYNDHKVVAP